MKAELETIKTEALQALKEIETLDALESPQDYVFWTQGKIDRCHEGHG